MTPTKSDALDAMAAFQRAVERRNLLGNEGPLSELGAAVAIDLRRGDFAAVVVGFDRMIRTAERMPCGTFVWRQRRPLIEGGSL